MRGEEVALRPVEAEDLPLFFAHQADVEAARVAAFPSRDRAAFDAHWAKILQDPAVTVRTVLCGGRVAGNILSFGGPAQREVGYWLGREYWGRGVATEALGRFLGLERTRPLYAHVASANGGSARVLEKCGFSLVETRRAPLLTGGEGVEEQVWRLDRG